MAMSSCADAESATEAKQVAEEVSAEQYFEESCALFDPETAIDAFLNGMDAEQVEGLADALDYAWAAAEGDSAEYESYAVSLQAFAEGMGQVIAMDSNPAVAPSEIMDYMKDIPFPKTSPKCPELRPDTGGLPLPGEGPTAVSN